jgi:hypothetical protein
VVPKRQRFHLHIANNNVQLSGPLRGLKHFSVICFVLGVDRRLRRSAVRRPTAGQTPGVETEMLRGFAAHIDGDANNEKDDLRSGYRPFGGQRRRMQLRLGQVFLWPKGDAPGNLRGLRSLLRPVRRSGGRILHADRTRGGMGPANGTDDRSAADTGSGHHRRLIVADLRKAKASLDAPP